MNDPGEAPPPLQNIKIAMLFVCASLPVNMTSRITSSPCFLTTLDHSVTQEEVRVGLTAATDRKLAQGRHH